VLHLQVNISVLISSGIVELLIQNATILGAVPEEVGVAALDLMAMFGITKAVNQNSVNDDTLPDRVVEGKKQRTSTLSGSC